MQEKTVESSGWMVALPWNGGVLCFGGTSPYFTYLFNEEATLQWQFKNEKTPKDMTTGSALNYKGSVFAAYRQDIFNVKVSSFVGDDWVTTKE